MDLTGKPFLEIGDSLLTSGLGSSKGGLRYPLDKLPTSG